MNVKERGVRHAYSGKQFHISVRHDTIPGPSSSLHVGSSHNDDHEPRGTLMPFVLTNHMLLGSFPYVSACLPNVIFPAHGL